MQYIVTVNLSVLYAPFIRKMSRLITLYFATVSTLACWGEWSSMLKGFVGCQWISKTTLETHFLFGFLQFQLMNWSVLSSQVFGKKQPRCFKYPCLITLTLTMCYMGRIVSFSMRRQLNASRRYPSYACKVWQVPKEFVCIVVCPFAWRDPYPRN